MKRGLLSLTVAGAICGAATLSFAGAPGEDEPMERPVAPPAPTRRDVERVEVTEPADVIRKWAAFSTDAETARGLWLEFGSFYGHEEFLQDTPTDGESHEVSSFLRLAYGQELWEAGAEISYDYYKDELDLPVGNAEFDDDGFGDLDVWGKIIPLRTEFVNLGGGLVVSFPTGESDFRGFQTYRGAWTVDEYGFNPFLTAGFLAGPVHIRTSAGYQLYTSFNDFDGLDYNAAILVPIGDMVAIRSEFDGFHFCDDDADVVDFVPGVDIRLPMGDAEFLIRPTGAVGLTGQSRDWGVGLSFAITGIGGV